LETGKAYIVRKNIFNFKVGQILTLKRCGYQAYYGEYNYVFTDTENTSICIVLRDDVGGCREISKFNPYSTK